GAIAAPIWGAYMKSAKGKFCGDFPKPKVPFSPQPFFGKYSRSGGKSTTPDNQTTPGTAGQPGIVPAPPPAPNNGGTQANGNGNGNGNDQGNGKSGGKHGGGSKYPPDAYESPPQKAPSTKPPSQNGGAGAPSPG